MEPSEMRSLAQQTSFDCDDLYAKLLDRMKYLQETDGYRTMYVALDSEFNTANGNFLCNVSTGLQLLMMLRDHGFNADYGDDIDSGTYLRVNWRYGQL